jgi:uncharacterized protein YbaP (TraB family)
MKASSLLVLLCLFLISPLAASGESLSSAAEGEHPKHSDNCLLWRITGNGLEDTSWLYGTIHLINQDDFVVRKEVEHAISSCATVAFELKLNDLGMMAKMMRMLQLPGDSTLADVIDADRYELLRQYVEDSSGLSFASFETQKPLALMQLLLQRMIPGTPASYELHFLQMAVGAGQEIVGLEDIEDQMSVFDGIPYSEQVDWILEMYIDADSMKRMYAELVDAYLKEDLSRMQVLMLEESPELAQHSETLLDQRNRNWIPVIEGLMAESPVFVAVGAAHLPGPEGVVSLLKKAGYTVEPVPAQH